MVKAGVVRFVLLLGLIIGLLAPASFTSSASAATSDNRVRDDKGNLLASAKFNSGHHGAHSGSSDAGFNSFVLVDRCFDGLKVGVTWDVDHKIYSKAAPEDCSSPFGFNVFSFRTGQATSQVRQMSWYAWVEDAEGNRPHGGKIQDDWMGSASFDEDDNYFIATSVYNDQDDRGGDAFTASMWPSAYSASLATGKDAPAMWSNLRDRTPLPEGLTDDQLQSMYKQLWCHAMGAKFGFGGDTWDLEAWRPNISWEAVGGADLEKHKCNWGDGYGGGDSSPYYPPTDPDEPPADLAPVVDAGPDVTGHEGTAIKLDGSAVDDRGAPSVRWTYRALDGVDSGARCSLGSTNKPDTTIRCTDDGKYLVTLTADDNVNRPVSDSAVLTVKNVAPELTLRSPDGWQIYRVDSSVGLVAPFTDPGSNDTHTCTVSWDDGTTSRFAAVDDSCNRSRTFEHAGMYTMKVTVTDDDARTPRR